MTVPRDENISKVVDLQTSIRALENLPEEDRIKASMMLASFFMEYAAFEMASCRSAKDVAEIIVMAAKLERAATAIVSTPSDENRDAQVMREF